MQPGEPDLQPAPLVPQATGWRGGAVGAERWETQPGALGWGGGVEGSG